MVKKIFFHFQTRLHVLLWITNWLRLWIFRRPRKSEPVDESTQRRCQRKHGDLHLQQRRQASCQRQWIQPVQRWAPVQLRTESQHLRGPAHSQWPVPLSGLERCQQGRQQLPWGAPPCPVYVIPHTPFNFSPVCFEIIRGSHILKWIYLPQDISFSFFQTPCWDSLYGLCMWYRNNGMMMLFCQTPLRMFLSQWTRILLFGAAELTWPAAVTLTLQQTRSPGTGRPLVTAQRCRWDQDRCCLLPGWSRLTLDSTSAGPRATWGRTTRLSCSCQWSSVGDTLSI